jgi:hypothetical protein
MILIFDFFSMILEMLVAEVLIMAQLLRRVQVLKKPILNRLKSSNKEKLVHGNSLTQAQQLRHKFGYSRRHQPLIFVIPKQIAMYLQIAFSHLLINLMCTIFS